MSLSRPQLLAPIAAVLLVCTLRAALAQEDEEEPYRPGLIREVVTAAGSLRETVAAPQLVRGELAPGGAVQEIRWTGQLDLPENGEYRFAAYFQGELQVRLGERTLWEHSSAQPEWREAPRFTADFGLQPLRVRYRPPAEAAGELALFWAGPTFGLEPLPPRMLLHSREQSPSGALAEGRSLARALRCDACHLTERRADPRSEPAAPLPAPSLRRLAGQLDARWLSDWLTAMPAAAPTEPSAHVLRRMPRFGLSRTDAEAIAAHLQAASEPLPPEPPQQQPSEPQPAKKKTGKAAPPAKPAPPSVAAGQRLFLTLGCLACHQRGELGASGLFGGGDLTHVARKRPAAYFSAWLANPQRLNPHARMPVFDLSAVERASLALFLSEPAPAAPSQESPPQSDPAPRGKAAARGAELIQQHRCGACHDLPGAPPDAVRPLPASPPAALTAQSNWRRSCALPPSAAAEPTAQQPRYALTAAQASALQAWYAAPAKDEPTPGARSVELVRELNCLACHAREGRLALELPVRKLAEQLPLLAQHEPELTPLLPALTPPSLSSVGDKLTDDALAAAIGRTAPPHRDYLLVRMPRFNLPAADQNAVAAAFIAEDRIPAGAPQALAAPTNSAAAALTPAESDPEHAAEARRLAGPRLVGVDGLGCTSCHAVGSVQPEKAPLNARGPSLSLLARRIRRAWYERWVRSPTRIVPRMEMPSVQTPVRGVLGGNLGEQIAAVWETLNTPGFEPPLPNPVRVLRFATGDAARPPHLVTDLVLDGETTYTRPALIGLPNRHNVLLDLATGRLIAWRQGDLARQRTKGKSWSWEPAGAVLLQPGLAANETEFMLTSAGPPQPPQEFEQNRWPLVRWSFAPGRLALETPLRFGGEGGPGQRLALAQHFSSEAGGFRRELQFGGLAPEQRLQWRLVGDEMVQHAEWRGAEQSLNVGQQQVLVDVPGGAVRYVAAGVVELTPPVGNKPFTVLATYRTALPADEYHAPPLPVLAAPAGPVTLAPGWQAERLPLAEEYLPTALAFDPAGRLFFASLKGQLVRVESEQVGPDGLAPSSVLLDGLPAPYGLFAGPDFVDVVAKYALVRTASDPAAPRRAEVVASGWGYTADYHDWAVGLPPSAGGGYYLAIPCQQDNRTPEAASYRGTVLELAPRRATGDDPRLFSLNVVSRGHRFPMGIAQNRAGALFVTDNQGNYNPFNELNFVRAGAHFGFLNALDKKLGLSPPHLTPPAIEIPHPWTRSVNGICFLETPPALVRAGKSVFGPWEGHLVGCEYDTRRLVRMSLEPAGEGWQGCVYPLSETPADAAAGLLGPVNCAVSPRGELYIGSFRESGWGAGANVGEIVRARLDPAALPCGIAEVRALPQGFRIDFAQPVAAEQAADAGRYALASYRRESTPAYGGPDLDRRTETIVRVTVAPDRRSVALELRELRPGFVYELRLKNLTADGGLFYPAEAHYTLRQVPRAE